MKKSLRLTWRKAFTLIELLVVISIIAVLAGLAFPALQGALDTAKKAQASTMCNQLATAVTMYNTEYGVWPSKSNPSSDTSCTYANTDGDWTALVKCLNGNNSVANPGTATDGSPSNSRFIQFMSFNKKDMKGYPNNTTDVLYSPVTKAQKSPQQRYYYLICDGDYDGVIKVPDLASTSSKAVNDATIAQGVAAWANGDADGYNSKKVSSFK